MGLMTTILEGMREKCFPEELLAKTVILIKHEATLLDINTRQPVTHIPLNLLVTVRDPKGHSIIRQQGKPINKIFMTAAVDGEHTICFQAMPTQFSPNLGARLAFEVFIGDDRDPRITAPIEVQLHDLSVEISHNNQKVADIKMEQALQREREFDFRRTSDKVLSATFWYAALQTLVLIGTVTYQIHHLKKFFLYKKIV